LFPPVAEGAGADILNDPWLIRRMEVAESPDDTFDRHKSSPIPSRRNRRNSWQSCC